jgi:hypothetical protein
MQCEVHVSCGPILGAEKLNRRKKLAEAFVALSIPLAAQEPIAHHLSERSR